MLPVATATYVLVCVVCISKVMVTGWLPASAGDMVASTTVFAVPSSDTRSTCSNMVAQSGVIPAVSQLCQATAMESTPKASAARGPAGECAGGARGRARACDVNGELVLENGLRVASL